MLYRFYAIFGTVSFLLLRPALPLLGLLGARFGYGLNERFGHYENTVGECSRRGKRIWLHAASVGEVQAAVNLIEALEEQDEPCFFLTVTTEQGHRVAGKKLSGRATCLMAPVDVPFVVRRALGSLRPDLFICVETELWPALLTEVRRSGVRMCLVNGRMSGRSFGRYQRIRGLMRQLLGGFAALAVIGPEDGRRFAALGVPEERILVSGNSKYAHASVDLGKMRDRYRQRLGLEQRTVFICGSTRSGEEELLVPVYEQLRRRCGNRLTWIIAPRHLERIPALKSFFARRSMETALFSTCTGGEACADILLVDTMGELADLYATGDLNFCGGSLVARGGHNIMEVVRWGLPVYFGPHMDDFRDAAGMVVAAGAGFQVADAGELAELMIAHLENRTLYEQACRAAAGVRTQQCEAVGQQAEMVRGLLKW